MRSSTSSSDPDAPERLVPAGNWPLAALISVVVTLIVMGAWEARVRAMGYGPSINETADLWASQRERLDSGDVEAVIVGASRVQFDVDLEVWAEHFGGERPVQLAMPGTNPLGLLESVAEATAFKGTVLIGVTPGLWFVPQGPPVEQATHAVGRFENWSPSQRVSLALGLPLQHWLAYWNPEDLTLGMMVEQVELPMRPGAVANQPPLFPPYFAWMDEHRQAFMWDRCYTGSPLALDIQQRWLKLFTPPPPPPHMTHEEFMAAFGESVEASLERIRVAVHSLRERGCRVVFVRPPSTGGVRELEAQFSPREAFYDRMVEVAGVPGIHFEDHPELAAFDCPEWSHLTAEDAREWTRRLMPLIDEALAGQL